MVFHLLTDIAIAVRRHESFQQRSPHRQQLCEELAFRFVDPLPLLNSLLDRPNNLR